MAKSIKNYKWRKSKKQQLSTTCPHSTSYLWASFRSFKSWAATQSGLMMNESRYYKILLGSRRSEPKELAVSGRMHSWLPEMPISKPHNCFILGQLFCTFLKWAQLFEVHAAKPFYDKFCYLHSDSIGAKTLRQMGGAVQGGGCWFCALVCYAAVN